MVELFHRDLKASFKASSDSSKWTKLLPLILLNIQCTLKQDLQCTPAQLVYGTTLRLPGQFFTPSCADKQIDPTIYADRLSSCMQQLRPASPPLQSPSSHVPPNLPTCTHVFVHLDALRKPLQPPYNGPYKVLCRQDKHYILEINGKRSTISLDCSKPACLEPHITPTPSITLQTRCLLLFRKHNRLVLLTRDDEIIFLIAMELFDICLIELEHFLFYSFSPFNFLVYYILNVTFQVHFRGEPCSNSIFSYLMLHSTHSFTACFSTVHCHHFLSTDITLTFHCVITPCSFFKSNFLQHIAKLYLALPFQQRFYVLHLYT